MQSNARHISAWSLLMTLVGVVAAVVVYVLTKDVVWTVVPLLLTVAVVRGLVGRGGTSR